MPPAPPRLLKLRLEPRSVSVQLGMVVSPGLQFIEHGGHIPRHADLIALGMVGLGLLHGALDVKGEERGGMARTQQKERRIQISSGEQDQAAISHSGGSAQAAE
jgi:hypothetical protein